jgi:EpsI family protein
MNASKTIFVPVLLAAQALLVHWAGTFEHPPAMPELARFPERAGDWEKVAEAPVDDATKAQLGADRLLNSTYVRPRDGGLVNFFVAWFQSQRAGTSQPHSPQVCLPASGWTPESSSTIHLDTAAGRIDVNRYVIAKGPERAVVLYWYQTPRRVIANEWAAKFWLMADAPRDRRTDTSLVRITAWVTPNADLAAATNAAREYAGSVYPLLRQALP